MSTVINTTIRSDKDEKDFMQYFFGQLIFNDENIAILDANGQKQREEAIVDNIVAAQYTNTTTPTFSLSLGENVIMKLTKQVPLSETNNREVKAEFYVHNDMLFATSDIRLFTSPDDATYPSAQNAQRFTRFAQGVNKTVSFFSIGAWAEHGLTVLLVKGQEKEVILVQHGMIDEPRMANWINTTPFASRWAFNLTDDYNITFGIAPLAYSAEPGRMEYFYFFPFVSTEGNLIDYNTDLICCTKTQIGKIIGLEDGQYFALDDYHLI